MRKKRAIHLRKIAGAVSDVIEKKTEAPQAPRDKAFVLAVILWVKERTAAFAAHGGSRHYHTGRRRVYKETKKLYVRGLITV